MIINSKTALYLSCSSAPGNFGASLYNYFFNKYNINAIYLPRYSTSPKEIIYSLKSLNCSGCSISMPLKSSIIPFLDDLSDEANESKSVNTITNTNGTFKGHNTDIYGAKMALEEFKLLGNVAVYGSGSVVSSIILALKKMGVQNISIISRNALKGEEMSKAYNVNYLNSVDSLSQSYELFINATPSKLNSNLKKFIEHSSKVFDLAVAPNETEIIKYAKKVSKVTIPGIKMTKYQFQQQFFIYTNININMTEIDKVIENLFFNKNIGKL